MNVCVCSDAALIQFIVGLYNLCVPELTRVQLADGALVDIFCSVYSVSCKVLNLHCFSSTNNSVFPIQNVLFLHHTH